MLEKLCATLRHGVLIVINKHGKSKLNYGNWISKKLIIAHVSILFIFLALSMTILLNSKLGMLFIVLSIILMTSLLYLLYAHYQFSPRGNDIQNKIYNLVIDRIDFDGNGSAIDIGCGNGPLVITLAKKYPKANITGVDNWEGLWDYSKATCESNAIIEGVRDRVGFIKASASSLPFPDESFDLAVSNFVFHEVKDTGDKRKLIKEALRVVKKNGKFIFQDLFLSKYYYGNIDELVNELKLLGIQSVNFINTSKADFIPKLLKSPVMVGKIGIIYGIK
jgi:ubiquinone/menaquinone biosynthesis C-methylase UbiE